MTLGCIKLYATWAEVSMHQRWRLPVATEQQPCAVSTAHVLGTAISLGESHLQASATWCDPS